MDSHALDRLFAERVVAPSDINEHLVTLRRFAKQCDLIVEFGTRGGNSTVGLLAGLADRQDQDRTGGYPAPRLETLDIDENAVQHVTGVLDPTCSGEVAGVEFAAVHGSSLDVVLPDGTDMVFFDSKHTYAHLKQELIRHGDKAQKFLAFHDTKTFGESGEDGTTPGLMQAIDEFRKHFPHWEVAFQTDRNNGLLVLAKRTVAAEQAAMAARVAQAVWPLEPEEWVKRFKPSTSTDPYERLDKLVADLPGSAYEVAYWKGGMRLKVAVGDLSIEAKSEATVEAALAKVRETAEAHLKMVKSLVEALGG